MVISQGDVFWLDLGTPDGSGPGYRRPYMVIQNNVYNRSAIQTTVVCAITSNIDRALVPGNILLRKGEGGLPRQSVINVTQLYTIDKSRFTQKIGTLSHDRVRQALEGISRVLQPREP
jgi:mRNA interferase MazF